MSDNASAMAVSASGINKEMEIKLKALQHIVTDWNMDIFGLTEANTCWDVLPEEQRLAS